ncbi:hypothetical protein KW869_25790 [Pseudomonas urmiensis]|jgi:hypothetical protein|uniref:Uncharacterized protein n=1 Tax=Pseudomonas urmiensis TaxID=2745493 RepID=A0ABW8P4B5_9PSED
MLIYISDHLPDPATRLSTNRVGPNTAVNFHGDHYYIKVMDLPSATSFILRGPGDDMHIKSFLYLANTGWLRCGDIRTAPKGIIAPGLYKID